MNKKQLIPIFILAFYLLTINAMAGEIVKPLGKSEVESFLNRLNQQKILIAFDKSLSKNKVIQYEPINNSFMLEGSTSAEYFVYKVDINNDGVDEHVLCFIDGSGSFLNIDAIYKEKNGKFVDILDEIKKPMRKLVKVALTGDQDLVEGYCGFMGGSIKIEKENSRVFFTLQRVVRDYDAFSVEYNPPEGFKVLWDKGVVKLVEHHVGNHIYKIEK